MIFIMMLKSRIAYIYALSDPRDHAIRYIGKAEDPHRRIRAHLTEKADRRKNRWILVLKRLSLVPELHVLEVVADSEWKAAERKWIKYWRSLGADLTNHTDGGEGLQNATADTRAKLAEIRRKAWARTSPEEREARMRDPERRRRISEALRGRPAPWTRRLPQNQPGRPAGRGCPSS